MQNKSVDINTYLIELQNGNVEALTSIYLLTKTQVYAVCLSILRDRGLAEDAMQNTYIRIQEKINYYKKGSNGSAWITTIAKNLSINDYNRNSRQLACDFSENEFLTSSEDKLKTDDSPIFKLAKKHLNEDEFKIVMLYVIGGYKHREIADIVEKPLGSVLWTYNNAIKKLRKLLEKGGK